MKRIRLFTNEMDAHMSRDLLASNGVQAQVVGAKEYVSHVLGGGVGNYELLVDPDDESKADKILRSVEVKAAPEPVAKTVEKAAPNYYGRAIFYACAAWVILPVIFNYASIANAMIYWQSSPKHGTAKAKMAVIFLLQIPTLVILYLIATSLPDYFK